MPPSGLIQSLQAVRRKVKILSVTFGAGVATAALVGLLLAVLLVDYALRLDWEPRLIVVLAAIAGAIYAIVHWIVIPWRSSLHVGAVAGRIEHTFPQFDDRLRSTVDFANGQIPGSQAMQDRVIAETAEMARNVNFNKAIARGPVYWSLTGGLASLTLLATLAIWGMQSGVLGIALNRLAMGSRQWPKSVEIEMIAGIPQRVAAGQRIPVRLRLAKGDRDSRTATIEYRYDNGAWQREIMNRADNGEYSVQLDARLEQGKDLANLEVRVAAGDDEKLLKPISVVPRLQIAHVEAAITPPAYVQSAVASNVNMVERTPIAAVGSQIAIKIDFNKALDSKSPVVIKPVSAGATAPTMTWDRAGGNFAVAHFQAEKTLRFNILATDSDGFQNAAGEEYELAVREDQPPSIQIEEPKRSEERTANAAFEIKAVGEDDYGIVGAQLVVHRLNDGGKNASAHNEWIVDLVSNGNPAVTNSTLGWELADSTPEHKRYHLIYGWQLEQLAGANLQPGDVLEYYLQVKDNFDLNGKQHDWVPSGKLRITIVSTDAFNQSVQTALEQIQAGINQLRQQQNREKAESDLVRQGVDMRKRFDEADRAQVSRIANDQSGTASQTMQISDKLQQLLQRMNENRSNQNDLKQAAADVQKLLQQTADGVMRDATRNLTAARDLPDSPMAARDQPNNNQQQSNNNNGSRQQPDAAQPQPDGQPQPANNGQQRNDNQQADANQQQPNGQPAADMNRQQGNRQQNAAGQQQDQPNGQQNANGQQNRDGQQQANAGQQNRDGQQNQNGQQGQDGKQQNQNGEQANNGQQNRDGQQQANAGQQGQNGQQQNRDGQPNANGQQNRDRQQQANGQQGRDGQQQNREGQNGSQQASAGREGQNGQRGNQQANAGREGQNGQRGQNGSQQANAGREGQNGQQGRQGNQQANGGRDGQNGQNGQRGQNGSQQANAGRQGQNGQRNQGGNQQANAGQQNRSGQQNGQQGQSGQQQSGQQQSGQQQSGQQNQSGQQQQNGQRNQQNQQGNQQQQQDAQRRSYAINEATRNQQQSSDQLQQAMDRLGAMGGLPEAIQKLTELRDRQAQLENKFRQANAENIGKRNNELTPEEQKRNQEMAAEQRKQANDLQQAIKNMEQQADKTQRSDPEASRAMQQGAQSARQQNIQSNQQQAAESMEQNQQAQAQQNQRQAELGIDVVLNKLKAAEKAKLEQLSKKLATMQQAISDLLFRQSNHNLDNLMIQGGKDLVGKVETAKLAELLDYSQRDLNKIDEWTAVTVAQLSGSQEQTQRNTADIAKQAESLPDPAPATKLTQAASQMERAIVHLRANKPVDAYDPPQVEALAALIEAAKNVEEAAKKADEEQQKQDTETLKQAYVNLLVKQKKLGTDIVTVDKTPKDNGDLPRDVQIKLGQLPTDQGKLIEEANKIGERVKDMDSIVYDWANQDIVKAMGEVKDGLAKPQTGQPTQLAARHVEEQLQAMIDSLVQRVARREFNDRNNQDQQGQGQGQRPGQGQGQNKPKLPSEVELRLLQKNQQIINDGTVTADAAKAKDKEQLLDLGAHQGDLRNLLDQLVQKASQGKEKLGAEPDNRDQLPEEASKEDIENQELTKNLLQDNPDDDSATKKIKLTGDRMGRSRQRLALNDDPGKVTQEIQKKIILDMEDLIKAAQAQNARQQRQRQQQRPGQRQQQQPSQQQRNQGQQQLAQGQQQRDQQQGGNQSAQESVLRQGRDPIADLTKDPTKTQGEWGGVTKRDRQTVQERSTDQTIEKYKKQFDDFNRNMAEQASKQR